MSDKHSGGSAVLVKNALSVSVVRMKHSVAGKINIACHYWIKERSGQEPMPMF